MAYNILVFDLDGTLTNTDKQISPATLAALQQAQTQGCTLVLASGRPTPGIAPIAEQLALGEKGGYVLSYNGGRIIDWRKQEIVFQQSLSLSLVARCYRFAQQFALPIVSYRDQEIVGESPVDSYIEEECRINQMPYVQVKDFLATVRLFAFPPTKCLMTGSPERLLEIMPIMQADLQGQMEVFRSAPFFLELVPRGIDKAQSLARLLQMLGKDRSEMMAFGDGFNDLSMLQYAGMGVAMGNAEAEVKAAADWVTGSNNEDGIVPVLERYVLSDKAE